MRLRKLTMDDADRVFAWRNTPSVANMMFTNDPIERSEHLAWLERVLNSPTSTYWMIEHDDRPVGVANLVDIDLHNSRCAWAYYIGEPETPGPIGLAVEFEIMAIVFADMGLNKLTSEVLAFNDRVIRLHEHVGFVREGVLRDHICRADGVFDVVVLSMLREEWQERHSKRRR